MQPLPHGGVKMEVGVGDGVTHVTVTVSEAASGTVCDSPGTPCCPRTPTVAVFTNARPQTSRDEPGAVVATVTVYVPLAAPFAMVQSTTVGLEALQSSAGEPVPPTVIPRCVNLAGSGSLMSNGYWVGPLVTVTVMIQSKPPPAATLPLVLSLLAMVSEGCGISSLVITQAICWPTPSVTAPPVPTLTGSWVSVSVQAVEAL